MILTPWKTPSSFEKERPHRNSSHEGTGIQIVPGAFGTTLPKGGLGRPPQAAGASRPLNAQVKKPSVSSSTWHVVLATSAFPRLVPQIKRRDLFQSWVVNHCLLDCHIMDNHSALLQKCSYNPSISTNFELSIINNLTANASLSASLWSVEMPKETGHYHASGNIATSRQKWKYLEGNQKDR